MGIIKRGTLNREVLLEKISVKVCRVSWKPTGDYPQYQQPDFDGIPAPVTYTDVVESNEDIYISHDTGEIELLRDTEIISFSVLAHIAREAGNKAEDWGLFIEYWDGSSWTAVPDSLALHTMLGSDRKHVKPFTISLTTKNSKKGGKFRLMQVCSKVKDGIGIAAGKPFASLPATAGIILNIITRSIGD